MYPPPPKAVTQQLTNSSLESVGHGQYVIHLNFENGNGLTFSAPFRFAEKTMLAEAPLLEFPLLESKLVRVLGCHISKLECDVDGTLELQFSNGDALTVYANDPAYEAYTLLIGGKEYVV